MKQIKQNTCFLLRELFDRFKKRMKNGFLLINDHFRQTIIIQIKKSSEMQIFVEVFTDYILRKIADIMNQKKGQFYLSSLQELIFQLFCNCGESLRGCLFRDGNLRDGIFHGNTRSNHLRISLENNPKRNKILVMRNV